MDLLTLVVGIVCVLFQTVTASPRERILEGQSVDTLRRFPHHVTITRDGPTKREYCSGSIVAARYILTSVNCVPEGEFTVHFGMKYFNKSRNSFSITLNENAVIPYPTGYDNIALIHLPIVLSFTEEISSISYSSYEPGYYAPGGGELRGHYGKNNGFVVMPGFTPLFGNGLSYGMFKLITPTECKAKYGRTYDEYLEICTLGWGNNRQVPCEGNEGGGLITGWPREPKLVGIFTSSANCVSNMPAIYVNLVKYDRWIDQVISGHYRKY